MAWRRGAVHLMRAGNRSSLRNRRNRSAALRSKNENIPESREREREPQRQIVVRQSKVKFSTQSPDPLGIM